MANGFELSYNGFGLRINQINVIHDGYGSGECEIRAYLPSVDLSQQHPNCKSTSKYGKGVTNMSTVKKIAALTLDEDTKLLRKYDIIDDEGFVTEEGTEVLIQVLFDKYKGDLVEKLTQLDEAEKPKQIAA